MNVVVRPRVRYTPTRSSVEAARLAPPQASDQAAIAREAESPSHRWFVILGVPFVLGAAFFALALGLDKEWPMVPAFLFGPFLLIAGYVYLCLSSDSNRTST